MANDFLFHKVTDKEKEEIKKQAKGIMDSFSAKLAVVDEKAEEPFVERTNSERKEKEGSCGNLDKEIMFENAPSKNSYFIVAEKGEWI
jgi:Asp-tRNA(Asn)/Glu-tRNA(Gln) amidotransferase C subunit